MVNTKLEKIKALHKELKHLCTEIKVDEYFSVDLTEEGDIRICGHGEFIHLSEIQTKKLIIALQKILMK